MVWTYREAVVADAGVMRTLYQECYSASWNCTPDLVSFDVGVIEKLITGKHLHTTILEEDGVLAAFISMWFPKEPADEAFGDVVAINLTKYKSRKQRVEVVSRILGGMWRLLRVKGRMKIRTDLSKLHVEAISLIRDIPVIADRLSTKNELEIDVNDGIAWMNSEGY